MLSEWSHCMIVAIFKWFNSFLICFACMCVWEVSQLNVHSLMQLNCCSWVFCPHASCPLLCRWVYEIDADSDGKVTRVEIVEWIMRNEDKGNSKEIDLQWSIYDSDHSGQVSWEEYRTVFLKSKMEYSSWRMWEGSRGGALRGREGSPYGLLTERYAIHMCMHASVSVYVWLIYNNKL